MKKNEPLFIGEYDKSVILTYMGAAFALLAVYAIIQSQLRLAMMAFIVSGICDLFDGVVARRMKRTESQKRFGIEIDSLCDMISFALFRLCSSRLSCPWEWPISSWLSSMS